MLLLDDDGADADDDDDDVNVDGEEADVEEDRANNILSARMGRLAPTITAVSRSRTRSET